MLDKRTGWLLGLLCVAVLSVSCNPPPAPQSGGGGGGSSKPAPGKPRIGVSLMNRQHDFYKDLEEGLKAEGDKEGFEVVVRDADFKLAKQAADIEDFVVQKVDALIVCPVDSKGVGKAISTANQAKIPVFTADIAADTGQVECHVASDNVQGGRSAADYMGKLLGGKGNVLIVDWPYATSVLDRVKGFEDGLKAFPDMKVIGKPDGGAQRDSAMKTMENMLQAHPDIDGIFAINDDTALGCLSAVQAAKRDKIVIVGYDAIPEARDAIKKGGPLKADVAQFPKDIGQKAIEAVGKFLKKEKVPAKIPVDVKVIDKAYLETATSAGK